MALSAANNTCLMPLQHIDCWREYLAYHAERHPRRTTAKQDFEALLPRQDELAATILSSRYRLAAPRQVLLNRLDGRRKRLVFVYPRQDELVLKLCCRLASRYDPLLPDGCHAFRPGRSARTAFAALTKKPGLDKLACIRLDITDFFNAIPPEKALEALPEQIRQDAPLYTLLKDTVLAQVSGPSDSSRRSANTGIRPGTPAAPLLANHYLAAFDRKWMATGWPYARYSDDIILFVPPNRLKDTFVAMKTDLASLGLSLNTSKSHIQQPGEPWEFLGFSSHHGQVDLCDAAVRKLKNRIRRLARRLNRHRIRHGVPPDRILQYFFRRMNGRLFGYEGRDARFCWSRWYMPLLNTAQTLLKLDHFIEEQARYACTGRVRISDRHRFPRAQLKAAGFRTLVSFFYNREWVLPKQPTGTQAP